MKNIKNNAQESKENISPQAASNLKDILAERDLFWELWEQLYMQAKEKIETMDMEYIWEGKEGIVHKIEVTFQDKTTKKLLAVKRRFDNTLKNEIDIQRKFFDQSKKNKDIIKIPKVFWEISTNKGEYFLMEYIEGKTLFTLKMEKIAEYFYKKFQNKYPDFFWNIKTLNIQKDENDINKRQMFNFWSDEEARNNMFKILSFLNDKQEPFLKKYTNTPGIVLIDKNMFDTIIAKIYNDADMDIKIFNQKEWWKIQDKLKEFLYQCHKQWLFHRDIWGNPTNIMFIQKSDEIQPVIIDFGQGTIIKYNLNMEGKQEYERGDGPYGDEHETFIPDTDICHIINSLTIKPPKREPRELRI